MSSGESSTAVRDTAAAGVGCGCLFAPLALMGAGVAVIILGGFGVLLAPLIALYLLFHHGTGAKPTDDDGKQALQIFQGDGKGALDTTTVPADLVDHIQKAGALCDAVGPIVIAAQIEKASAFNKDLVGKNGEQGLSQLPPDIFNQYGKDDDGNDKVSALDAADSIMAQGRYLCDLVDQGQKLIDGGGVDQSTDGGTTINTALDLGLAGYAVGMDKVREAKGVPNTNEAQGYVLAVRAQFAKFQGIGNPSATE
ncbi:transglycosylase SLT domain-containing protein [Streptomyces mirabilis]|uniref:transglycosylase SLT domain-containing protein n=1 Tax=Streptomyces mirabilis TaxID=68239 RepID=UPI003331D574